MRVMKMGGKACESLVHGNRHREQLGFFKVMFGDDFSKVLFLPPKFAREVHDLVDQNFRFEDVNKQIWVVTLSIIDGRLAFQKGWIAFSKDHNLKIGDFLVFELTKASHFLVKVYDPSGCIRVKFSMSNSRKRKRTRATLNPVDINTHQTRTTDDSSSNKRNSGTVSTTRPTGVNETNVIIPVGTNTVAASETNELLEEAVYFLNRDAGHIKEDDDQRISLFDLSSFEQQGNGQAKKANMTVNPFRKEIVAARTSRMFGDNNDAIPTVFDVPNNSKKPEKWSEKPSMNTLPGNARMFSNSRREDPVRAVGNNVENEIEEVPVPITIESVEPNKMLQGRQEEFALNKTSAEQVGKVIYLRGFDKRLWPVFYKSNNTVGNGWDAFMEANNIGAEEVYIFKSEINTDPENNITHIYSVCRSRKV